MNIDGDDDEMEINEEDNNDNKSLIENDKFKIYLLCKLNQLINNPRDFFQNTKIPIFYLKTPELFNNIKGLCNEKYDIINSHDLTKFYSNFIKTMLETNMVKNIIIIQSDNYFNNHIKDLENALKKSVDLIDNNYDTYNKEDLNNIFNIHIKYTINFIKILENKIKLMANIRKEFKYIQETNILQTEYVKSNYNYYYSLTYIYIIQYYHLLIKLHDKDKTESMNNSIYNCNNNEHYIIFFAKINYDDETIKIDAK